MDIEKRLTDEELNTLAAASKIFNRLRNERISPEQRKAISEKARLAGLEVRRANAARRKAEKESGTP